MRQPPGDRPAPSRGAATEFIVVVDLDHEVAALEPEPRRRRVRRNLDHDDALAVAVNANSSATAGERLTTLAPASGAAGELELVARRVLARGDSA